MILTVLACVVGYLAVGVLVAFVGGLTGLNQEADHYTFTVFLWPIAVVRIGLGGLVMIGFGLGGTAKWAAERTRKSLAARKPPTEDEL